MHIFEPITVKNLNLKNRIVMPPMCTYAADANSHVTDRHLIHYGSRAIGGTALIIMEATGILPNGRITDKCLGIWEDEQIAGLKQVVDSCHNEGALIALQLNHAGRKCEAESKDYNYTVGPSAIAFDETYRRPRELSHKDLSDIKQAFCEGAKRADAAGFDAIELHGAHGYLLSSFLSPISNMRTDEYGGSMKNRARFLLEVLGEVREVWPQNKALLLRLSATDYLPGDICVFPLGEPSDGLTGNFSTTWRLANKASLKIGKGGTLRIKFWLACSSENETIYGRIYRNGSPVGTIRSTESEEMVVFTEDIGGWSPGDTVELWIKISTGRFIPSSSGSRIGIYVNKSDFVRESDDY